MTLLVTPAEMRAAEQAAIAAGRSSASLILAAGRAIAAWIDESVCGTHSTASENSSGRHAVALVGPGNNGGDALVALGLLSERGWHVSAVLLSRSEFGPLPIPAELLEAVEVRELDVLRTATLVLDGVYGISGRETLCADVIAAIQAACDARANNGTFLVALDVPSGINAESGAAGEQAFRADATLCLGLPKIGMVREPAASHVGELVLLDIGVDAATIAAEARRPRMLTSRDMRPLLPRRAASSHKSDAGTLLIVAGAPTYYGAPRLCGAAAMRVGAGLVALAAPAAIVPTIAGAIPELVMIPLPSDTEGSIDAIERFVSERSSTLRAVVIGPGLGGGERVDEMLEMLLGNASVTEPLTRLAQLSHVIDADGLNWIARRGCWPEKLQPGTAVFTPHAGELARLLDVNVQAVRDEPWETVRQAARESGQVVVLKLGYTAVASPEGGLWIAPRAMPEMATAGTGDVLAGTIGGFLAQGIPPLDAARLAVYVGSQAGSHASRRFGKLSVIAGDIIDMLPESLSRLASPYAP